MATTSSFSYNAKLEVIDRSQNFDGVGQSSTVYSGYDKRGTEEDVKRAYFSIRIGVTSGEEIIDLTDLAHELGNAIEIVDGTNQQLLYYRFAADAENAGELTIIPNSEDGYAFAGEDSKIVLKPSQWNMGGLFNSSPDILGDACKIKVAGAGGDVLEVTLILTNNLTS